MVDQFMQKHWYISIQVMTKFFVETGEYALPLQSMFLCSITIGINNIMHLFNDRYKRHYALTLVLWTVKRLMWPTAIGIEPNLPYLKKNKFYIIYSGIHLVRLFYWVQTQCQHWALRWEREPSSGELEKQRRRSLAGEREKLPFSTLPQPNEKSSQILSGSYHPR